MHVRLPADRTIKNAIPYQIVKGPVQTRSDHMLTVGQNDVQPHPCLRINLLRPLHNMGKPIRKCSEQTTFRMAQEKAEKVAKYVLAVRCSADVRAVQRVHVLQ